MEWNINDITEQAALNAQSMVQQWKEASEKRLFGGGGKKPTKQTTKSFSRTDIQNNKKRFLAQLKEAIKKHPEFNTPQWIQYFTTIADVETGGTFNENATSKTSSARGYFQILKPNRSTSNQFEDMFALTKQNQKILLAGLGKDGITKVMQNYTIPEIMALSHFQGANGAIKIFRGNKGVKDANGVSPYKYLNVFRNKIKNKKPVATIEENTNTSINSDLPFMETPLTALQIAQEYNGFAPQTPIPTSITAEELEIPEINVIPDVAKKELLRKAISQTLGLQTSIPQTSKIAFNPRVFIDDINSEIINEEQQNLQNILLQDAINRNVSNSAFRYALANDAQEEIGKQDQEIEIPQILNQTALGGPLFNSRTPIESFQGKKSSLPVVRYDDGGNLNIYNARELPEINIIGNNKPAIIMYDKNTGEYRRDSTGDILTPINTSISDNPADWTYQDKNGNLFTPHRQVSQGEITQGREQNGLNKILQFSNQHYNDPIIGAAARWSNDWHNDRNPVKAGLSYFDPTGLIEYGLDKGIDLYNKGTDVLGMDDAIVAGLSMLPIIGKGMMEAKKFTPLLDWSPENYFGKIGRHNRTRVDGSFIEPDAEDIRTLKSLVPEYNQIEEQAVKNGDFILDTNGNYIVVNEPSMSPYEYILRHSKNGQKYRQEHAYTGVSNVHKDAFLNNSQDTNIWTTRTKPQDVEEYASTPLGGEAPYTAERKAQRIQKYQDKLNRYKQALDAANKEGASYITIDGSDIPIERVETVIKNSKYMLNHEINEPILHGGSVYDVTIPNDISTHNWGNAGGAKWSVLPLDGTEKMSIENEIQSEIASLQNYLSTLDSNSSIPEQSRALIKSSIETKLKELQSKLDSKDFYYERPKIISTDTAVARDAKQGIGNTMIDNVMDTYNGTLLDESIYHAGVPKKVWLGNNGALDRTNKSPLKSLLFPIVSTSTVAPILINNDRALGGNLFLTGGEKIGEDIIRPLHNKVYNNYEDAVDNNMGPIMTGIRKGLRYIKDNISDSIPAGISNCTLTATQWVDPTNPIMSAKTIISNPDSVGYSKINADQVVPGDLLIAKVPGKDSYHTMYVSGFDKEGKPLLDYSRGGMGVEENLRTNIPLEWYTANSDGHTQNLYYRNNKFNKTVLPEIIITGKKKAEGGNLFQDGGNTLLTQNLPGIVVTRPYPSEQQIKQTIEKEWPSAVGLPQYRITKDPTFTRERTGAGSIEYFNEPSITYRNDTTVQNPNQEPTLLFDPNTNTVEDIKLDLLHHYREYDKEYQKLLLDYTNALIGNKHTASDLFWNSELGEQYRNKYGKDIEKHWDEWDQMVEENINNNQYLTQAIDGSLRSLMASDALREKSNYDTKEGAEASWLKDKYAKRAYNNIIKYLKTSKK